jgi:hypothetical protein
MITGVLAALLVLSVSFWTMIAAPVGGTPAELRLLFRFRWFVLT